MGTDLGLLQTISCYIAAGIGTFWFLCFFAGFCNPKKESSSEPSFLEEVFSGMSEQDMYAVASGDEEYLGAHLVCSEPEARPAVRPKPKQRAARPKPKPRSVKPKPSVSNADKELRAEIARLKKELKQKSKPVSKPASKPVAKKSGITVNKRLFESCISCLVSLGHKKGDAKTLATQCFKKNPNIKTVEEFVEKVFKK